MRPRLWAKRATLLAAVPLLIGGCGIGGGGSPPPAPPANPVNTSLLPHVRRTHHRGHGSTRPYLAPTRGARGVVSAAARLSRAQPGLRATGVLTTRQPGDSADRRTVMAVSDSLGQRALRAGLSIPLATASGSLQSYPVTVVILDGTMYLRPPAALAGRVPGGKPWWAVALSALPSFDPATSVGSVVQASSAINSPSSYLAYLGAFAADMHELGPATVNGIRTTHYKALLSVGRAALAVPGALANTIGSPLQAAAAAHPNALTAIDTWIDASHLVRRLHLAMTARSAQGQPIGLSVEIDFHSYLGVATPQAPPVSQTAHPAP